VPLGDLETVLRPYQKQGVYWLKSLQENGLAGVIADEMGLGKTVQALAFLRHIRGKSLIVCPSSLVFNWQREAARFTPDLRTLAVEGSERRELFGQPMQDADLIITSYPLLRRDIERYRSIEFTAAILDEAQHIKNPDSQNAQAACALRARHRFILTGTPLENSVRDLWSLMHFLMPGYLGTRVDFRERYEREIQNDPTGPSATRLIKRIKPFILRRLKRDVIKELPEKIEQVSYCELNDKQKDVYKELVNTTRRQVSESAGSKNQGKARMVMLTALLRLRQACCDLRLLGLEEAPNDEASGKVELLMELLEEVVDGGHRVLIFSQFVTMLHLLEGEFKERSISYCYLDGSTKDRAREVDRFQNGEAPAFLISLKAGGVGLNLTAADTVIHFDPWWNPAVEAQATDRAHRIGQNKVVTAYKLITRDTVEEKILALQQRKRAMTEATLESEQPLMEGLSISEIEEILA
jgi:SNF2 family DNA or RNA helicase